MTGDPKRTCKGDKAESEHRDDTYDIETREDIHANHLYFQAVHQAHEQNKMRPVNGTVKARLNSWTRTSLQTYIHAGNNTRKA